MAPAPAPITTIKLFFFITFIFNQLLKTTYISQSLICIFASKLVFVTFTRFPKTLKLKAKSA